MIVPKKRFLDCYLHGFGDASNKAYCAVVYFVYSTQDGVYVRLLTSRSRVAPLKALTIPRLELMSARILVQLHSNEENREHRKYFWNVYCVLTNHMRDLVTAENKWVSQSRNRVGSPFVLKDLHLNLQGFKLLFLFI